MIVGAQKKEWFESWFDSPYHNLLYKKRDNEEAEKLIGNLFKFIKPDPSSSILDIALLKKACANPVPNPMTNPMKCSTNIVSLIISVYLILILTLKRLLHVLQIAAALNLILLFKYNNTKAVCKSVNNLYLFFRKQF